MHQSDLRSPQSSQRTQSVATIFLASFALIAVRSRCVTNGLVGTNANGWEFAISRLMDGSSALIKPGI